MKGARWTVFLAGFVIGAVVVAAGWLAKFPSEPSRPPPTAPVVAGKRQLYQCAMHPQIVQDKPGLCPICQMRLEPVVDEQHAGAAPGANRKLLFYRHPMRPDVTSPTPAKDEMGMDYVAVYAEEI